MVVHKVQVVFGDRWLPLWHVSDDLSFYFGFYCNLYNELKSEKTNLNARYEITAIIRGGERRNVVVDDWSLIAIFAANRNAEDVIIFEVMELVDVPLRVDDPNVNVKFENCEVQGVYTGPNDEVQGAEFGEVGEADLDDDSADKDSFDPDWKNGKDYSSEEVSSESVGSFLVDSDGDQSSNTKDDIALSDEEYDEGFRRPQREGDPIHPNSNVPRVPQPLLDGGRIVLRQWQTFNDFRQFNAILKDYCIQEGFELKKIKYERARATFTCKAEECPWRIHASLAPDKLSFMIKTYNDHHTCTQVRSNSLATPTWLAQHLLESFKIHPDMDIKAMRAEIKLRFGLDIDNRRLWKARAKARILNEGDYVESFKMLRDYAMMVLQTNPNSMAIVNSELEGNYEDPNVEPPRFKRIFICFDGVRQGFLQGCRPFFGLDGCHLKGPYKGILLAAVGLDANLQLYPIAYAIVETKNKETWEWFVTLLKESIGETYNGNSWTLMSDRQKVRIFVSDQLCLF